MLFDKRHDLRSGFFFSTAMFLPGLIWLKRAISAKDDG
jgi:hypothetical protein